MKLLITSIVVLNSLLSTTLCLRTAKLVLNVANENRSITVRGDQCAGGAAFDSQDQEFSCVCLTGLWAFYQRECASAGAILGATNGQCFKPTFLVHKATLLSPVVETDSTSSAVAVNYEVSSIGGKFVTETGIPPKRVFVPPGFPVLITTGTQSWRIPQKKLCMKPFSLDSSITNYCYFKHSNYDEFHLINEKCSNDDEIVSPLICTPYMTDENAETNTTCAYLEKVHSRTPRNTKERAIIPQGRVFLEAVTGLQENATQPNSTNALVDLLDIDENHGLNVTIERPVMNTEIWNFMTYRAQIRLGIREPALTERSSIAYSPSFEFLEIAKKIQQKTCPEHYVTDEHYDIAVGAFESIQKNHLKYTDVFLDFPTSERIIDALTACLDNATEYPFIERMGKRNVSCNGSVPVYHSTYEMYDKVLQLTLGLDQTSRFNEPIVETVWKVFLHAHSACYPHFKNSYNDHHRFTTVMLQLFTNDINDMWFSIKEVKPNVYTGFLGDAVDLMDSVAYCAMFSRLASDYPWDLPRPKKENSRKKRQISESYSTYTCMGDYDARNVCPISPESLPGFQDRLVAELDNELISIV